jgi:hypothetical protein
LIFAFGILFLVPLPNQKHDDDNARHNEKFETDGIEREHGTNSCGRAPVCQLQSLREWKADRRSEFSARILARTFSCCRARSSFSISARTLSHVGLSQSGRSHTLKWSIDGGGDFFLTYSTSDFLSCILSPPKPVGVDGCLDLVSLLRPEEPPGSAYGELSSNHETRCDPDRSSILTANPTAQTRGFTNIIANIPASVSLFKYFTSHLLIVPPTLASEV